VLKNFVVKNFVLKNFVVKYDIKATYKKIVKPNINSKIQNRNRFVYLIPDVLFPSKSFSSYINATSIGFVSKNKISLLLVNFYRTSLVNRFKVGYIALFQGRSNFQGSIKYIGPRKFKRKFRFREIIIPEMWVHFW